MPHANYPPAQNIGQSSRRYSSSYGSSNMGQGTLYNSFQNQMLSGGQMGQANYQ